MTANNDNDVIMPPAEEEEESARRLENAEMMTNTNIKEDGNDDADHMGTSYADLGASDDHDLFLGGAAASDDDDDHSFHSGHSDKSNNNNNNNNNNNIAEEEIAAKETRWVLYTRSVTFGFLIVATVGVALATYFYVDNQERTTFDTKFHDNAYKVLEAIGTVLENTLGAVDAFTVSAVSHAAAVHELNGFVTPGSNGTVTESAWPFVTVPDIAVRGSKLRSLSKVFLFATHHYVEHKDRDAWENYTRSHDGWVDDGIATQKTDPSFGGNIVEEWSTLGQINWFGQRAEDAEFYWPRWQSAPVVPRWDPYNWNAYQHHLLQPAMQKVADTRQIVIAETYNIDPNSTQVELSDFLGGAATASEPAVEMYFPVVDDTSGTVDLSTVPEEDAGNVVAITSLSIQWRQLIRDILPIGNNGMITVFSNGEICNQTFTYEINGPEVVYLGPGDLHDATEFDDETSSESALLTELTKFSSKGISYTGPAMNKDFCPYRVTLYPSQVMAEEYLSADPYIFAASAVAIFLFTSLVFLSYDAVIEWRQKKVLKTAQQSSAIVDSLFPSNVKERLYQQEEQQQQQLQTLDNNNNSMKYKERMLKDFMTGGAGGGDQQTESSSHNDEPIADLFDETTVMFADIKGFTHWSSTRSPTQVFRLLETLYGAYDKIAARRKVYKIETIGDSYVAVCGLPEPQRDHAVVMAKFAADVRTKTTRLTQELRLTLGEGTEDLQIRIGLHSGSCTAGVLRGQRARFQLFGDTVNTAARMESNSKGNAIQASQDTADCLVAAGKRHWLTKRPDLVQAKGKGAMQCYWVEPHTPDRSSSTVHA